MAKAIKLVLAGEGGQGVQSVANIMAEAAYNHGKQALYIPNFGVEQRGGVSVAFVQISDGPISSLKFSKADIVVALSGRAVCRTVQYVDENTTYIYDSTIDSQPEGAEIPANAKKVYSIPAHDVVHQELTPRVFNVLIMGVVAALADFVTVDELKEALVHKLQYKFDKDPSLKEMNFKALDMGAAFVK